MVQLVEFGGGAPFVSSNLNGLMERADEEGAAWWCTRWWIRGPRGGGRRGIANAVAGAVGTHSRNALY